MYSQEQLDQIKVDNDARMASFSNKDTTTSVPDTGGSDDFLKTLQDKLLGSMDIVSSADTGIDQAITDAKASTTAARDAGASKIESQFGSKIEDIKKSGAQSMTSAREAQRGFGTNMAALRQLEESTDKQVKDYEQMKQEALLSNNTQFASQLSNLQLQSLQFKQESQQKAFSNMMQVAGLGIQIRAEERAGQQFTQNLKLQRDQMESSKQSEMLGLAANAGIQLNPGETYESLSKRIANSDITRLQKEKLQADIDTAKAKNQVDTTDFFANSIVGREISGGANASDAASTAIFELSNLYGVDVTLEQRNNIISAALLAEQQQKDSIAQDTNDSLQINDDIFRTTANTTGLRYDPSGVTNPTEFNIDTGDLPESLRQGDKPNQTGLSDNIYESLFGSI